MEKFDFTLQLLPYSGFTTPMNIFVLDTRWFLYTNTFLPGLFLFVLQLSLFFRSKAITAIAG